MGGDKLPWQNGKSGQGQRRRNHAHPAAERHLTDTQQQAEQCARVAGGAAPPR